MEDATTEHGKIGHLYIFSHAWKCRHHDDFGQPRNGGFYGGGPNKSGFYGQTLAGDHSDARTLNDLQTAIDDEKIKFASGKKIFLEGCHIGEIGTFVTELANITGRTVESACGNSSEYETGSDYVEFSAGAHCTLEKDDPDYDLWLRGTMKIGKYIKKP